MTKQNRNSNYRPISYDEARLCFFVNGKFMFDDVDDNTLPKEKHVVQRIVKVHGRSYQEGVFRPGPRLVLCGDYLVRVERVGQAKPQMRAWRIVGFYADPRYASDEGQDAYVLLRDVPFRANVADWKNEDLCEAVQDMLDRVGYPEGRALLLAF